MIGALSLGDRTVLKLVGFLFVFVLSVFNVKGRKKTSFLRAEVVRQIIQHCTHRSGGFKTALALQPR